jgi:predicted dehydrogenase
MSICLPDCRHEEAAIAAAEAGKAVLLENPLAYDAAAARRIVEAVERNGVPLMVGHILRFDPRNVKVHDAADPARLGAKIHIRAKRNGIRWTARRLGTACSILFYMGVHDVAAVQWIGPSRIARVYPQKREVFATSP